MEGILGYTSILSARGTKCDLSPPTPGFIDNMLEEIWSHELCESYIPDHVRDRCVGQTPINNYR